MDTLDQMTRLNFESTTAPHQVEAIKAGPARLMSPGMNRNDQLR